MSKTYPQLFDKQPSMNVDDIKDLLDRGFIVPESFTHAGRGDQVSNQNPGDLFSFTVLRQVLSKQREFTMDDAKRLVLIETTRKNGRPRASHLARFLNVIESCERGNVLTKINQWVKNQ